MINKMYLKGATLKAANYGERPTDWADAVTLGWNRRYGEQVRDMGGSTVRLESRRSYNLDYDRLDGWNYRISCRENSFLTVNRYGTRRRARQHYFNFKHLIEQVTEDSILIRKV